jgi:bifunctional enzyme CysN/CysC
MDGDLEAASSGQAVTLTLEHEIDVSRGDVIAPAQSRPPVTDQVHAHMIWMDEREMLPGRSYLIHLGTAFVGGQINRIKHTVNVNTLEETAASHLELNDVAVCDVAFDRPVPFDPYAENPATGAFIVIDRMTNATVGAGMIDYALRRATNVHWHDTRIDKAARAHVKAQRPCVLWFTGLSGAGKSVVSDLVEQRLAAMGKHTMMLDGDNIRHGLNRDLGFTDEDRVENIRRVAEVSRLMTDAGLITLVSFISPFRSERRMAREMLEEGEFLEVFVDAPLDVCEQRDPKGLYKKARAGEIPNFTGIGSSYEPPEAPELHLRSDQASPENLAGQVIRLLEARGML